MFRPPTEFTRLLHKSESGFGISMEEIADGRVMVTKVKDACEASKQDVMSGDEILSVAGVAIAGRGLAAMKEAQSVMAQQAFGTQIEWIFAREDVAPETGDHGTDEGQDGEDHLTQLTNISWN